MSADTPLSPVDRLGRVVELLEVLAAGTRPVPLLLDAAAAAELAGVSRIAWYRLVANEAELKPVDVPGVGARWRAADVQKWADRLRPRRRQPQRLTAP